VLIAGNWKMFKGPVEAAAFCRALRDADLGAVDVVVCPPYVSLGEAVGALAGTEIGVAAQNVHWAAEGPFTGEVSAPMLRELGVYGAIVGHSERRQFFGQTDEVVALTVRAVLRHAMTPILCVGETEEEREDGETESRLSAQVTAALKGLAADQVAGLVVAYEPIWAIGTGRTATAEDAQSACAHIRGVVGELSGAEAAGATRIQYGGSVRPENAAELLAQPDVDGALVGGASLDAATFTAIVQAAASVQRPGR
jgi:triosephosphate isomerase